MTGHHMAGELPNPGVGGAPGSGPQDQQPAGAAPHGAPDPAAVADQATRLDGVPTPHQPPGAVPPQPTAGPAVPPAPPGINYQPTAAAFPAQSAPGAPVGPYDPQAAPAYGYPQAAPTPPPYGAPQGGYGQPAPAPGQGGYGAPQFGQPAGYGYPGPAGMPMPAPVKQRNSVLLFGSIAGGVLAVAIVIALIVLVTGSKPKPTPSASGGTVSGGTTTSGGTSGSGGTTGGTTGSTGGTTTEAGKLNPTWTAKPSASGSDARTIGEWANDKLVVRGDAASLTAYNLSDGQVAWTLKPPSGTKSFCSMTADTNSKNIGGISFNLGDDDCAAVGAVDASTGKLLFQVGSPLKSKSYSTRLSITDTSLTAASSGLLAGFNLTDGTSLWSYHDRSDYCNDYADTAGSVVVVSDFCAGATPERQLTVLDAATGKSSTSYTLKGDMESLAGIVATKPLVLQMSSGTDSDYLVGFDASNNPMAKVPLKVTGSDKLRLSAATDPIAKDTVIGNTLYVEVQKNSKTAIQAIDLTAGTTLWTAEGPKGGLRLSTSHKNGLAVVVAIGDYGQEAKVGTLAAADGSFTVLNTFTAKNMDILPFEESQILVADDGRVLTIQSMPSDSAVTLYTKK